MWCMGETGNELARVCCASVKTAAFVHVKGLGAGIIRSQGAG